MRDVTHADDGPLFLDEDDVHPEKGDIAVCRCGRSDDYPFCDGSHRSVNDESDDELVRYVAGERKRVVAVEFADGTRLSAPELVADGDVAGDVEGAGDREE